MAKAITPTIGPIEPDKGAEWTHNWRSIASVMNFNLKGFTVDVNEILDVLGIKAPVPLTTSSIRFYLGVNTQDPNYDKGFHLIFCGVDDSGDDKIWMPAGDPGSPVFESGVYDLTKPCPPLCGTNDCLNTDMACIIAGEKKSTNG